MSKTINYNQLDQYLTKVLILLDRSISDEETLQLLLTKYWLTGKKIELQYRLAQNNNYLDYLNERRQGLLSYSKKYNIAPEELIIAIDQLEKIQLETADQIYIINAGVVEFDESEQNIRNILINL